MLILHNSLFLPSIYFFFKFYIQSVDISSIFVWHCFKESNLFCFGFVSGVQKGKLLGCYQDKKSMRLLSGYFTNLEQNNSPENCINLCLQSGFPYAGVEYW